METQVKIIPIGGFMPSPMAMESGFNNVLQLQVKLWDGRGHAELYQQVIVNPDCIPAKLFWRGILQPQDVTMAAQLALLRDGTSGLQEHLKILWEEDDAWD